MPECFAHVVVLLVLTFALPVSADTLIYAGSCENGAGGSFGTCAYTGLSNGELVSLRIGVNGAAVAPGGTIDEADVTSWFADFGDVSFSSADTTDWRLAVSFDASLDVTAFRFIGSRGSGGSFGDSLDARLGVWFTTTNGTCVDANEDATPCASAAMIRHAPQTQSAGPVTTIELLPSDPPGGSPLSSDPDGDGLGDAEEAARGTDANHADSDGDGIGDGQEIADASDPLDDASCSICGRSAAVKLLPIVVRSLQQTVEPADVGIQAPLSTNAGHPTFVSPHSKPIVLNGRFVYAANTPADTVDVIDTETREVVVRINVGVDPVGLAVRPDGREVWVANHISDTVSVIDTDPANPTFHQVVATVQAISPAVLATDFDEPVGVAFAGTEKAYVALGPDNEIAVIDVATRTVTGRLPIRAQDPRAIAVRGDRLYALAFESNNQTQLSGCLQERIDGDVCTFDAVEHVFTNNNVLSLNYDADIVKNPALPDRDLFVFDTATDQLLQVVESVGTLLYGLTVDSEGRVFVAQTDARNEVNGRAGTLGHGLAEMENRAFLNQVTRVDCGDGCGAPVVFDLEPLPPQHPEPGMALATPFGIQMSQDDSTLVVTAASSDKVFTMDPDTGAVLGRVEAGAVPRGIALESKSNGAATIAWVLNAVDNSVSVVDVASPSNLRMIDTISLDDPTHPDVKLGRMVFNDADASTTGTFSCESCHPDGHTDQLIWVLQTPVCDVDGCTQIPPRLTMPVRGLRDTAPYHWDGIPGDPFGGTNTASINAPVDPNCDAAVPESCTRMLVDGSMATTMCEIGNCPTNDEGKSGAVDGAERDALARFLLSVPFPPAQRRSFDNALRQDAKDGFFEFSFTNDSAGRVTGAQTCGDCHKMPFLVSTNTPGTGMDAPTWRGAYDRWMVTPQARLNIIDLMNLVGMDNSFPERDIWILAGASPDIWEMVLQGSTGFSGSFARQVTLNPETAARAQTTDILDALERSAADGAILLEAEGVQIVDEQPKAIGLEFRNGAYRKRPGLGTFTRQQLLSAAAAGELVITVTGRSGKNIELDYPQPALWPVAPIEEQTRNVELAFLSEQRTLRTNGRHVHGGASILLDGRKVDGEVRCESGTLPLCDDEVVIIEFDELPQPGGLRFLQLQNADGLASNDMMFFSEQSPLAPRPGNLITSGGAFTPGQFDNNWNTVEIATDAIFQANGTVHVNVRESSSDPWHAQLSHAVMVVAGQEYTLCYSAKAEGSRVMTAYLDTNMDEWRNISGGQHQETLTPLFQHFSHTFTVGETDLRARVAFDFAQSALDVEIDNIGLYEGNACGSP